MESPDKQAGLSLALKPITLGMDFQNQGITTKKALTLDTYQMHLPRTFK